MNFFEQTPKETNIEILENLDPKSLEKMSMANKYFNKLVHEIRSSKLKKELQAKNIAHSNIFAEALKKHVQLAIKTLNILDNLDPSIHDMTYILRTLAEDTATEKSWNAFKDANKNLFLLVKIEDAIGSGDENIVEEIETLLKAGADANMMYDEEYPIMMIAANCQNPRVVELLLQHGATTDDEMITTLKKRLEPDPSGYTIPIDIRENLESAIKILEAHLNQPQLTL